jgi:diguanylate cyclase (GGDEF)-like protein
MSAQPAADPVDDLLQRTQAAVLRGDHREGAKLAEAAVAELGPSDPPRRALALRLSALHHARLGDGQVSARMAMQALQLYRLLADPAGEAETLNTLCLAYNRLALYREALEFAIRALTIARELGDRRIECWALNRIGLSYEWLDDPELSMTYTREALELAKAIGGDEEIFAALNNLASSELAVAEWKTRDGNADAASEAIACARIHADEAVELARRSGNTHRETVALGNLAEAMTHGADPETAAAVIEQYQALARQHGYRQLELSADFDLACLLRHKGRHALAVQRLEQVLVQAIESDDAALRHSIEHALYDSHKALGQFDKALEHHEVYARMERERLLQQGAAQAAVLLARLEIDEARQEATRARDDAQAQRVRATQLEAEQRLLRTQAEELERVAREDPLTGLHNRRVVDESLPDVMAGARMAKAPMALAMVDVDHFKEINDSFGHSVGDQVLATLGRLLRANTRTSDLLARVGGEEFMIVLTRASIDLAHEICERLRTSVAQHGWQYIAPGLKVTVSLGLVQGADDEHHQQLIDRADGALYEAKRLGRNRVIRR